MKARILAASIAALFAVPAFAGFSASGSVSARLGVDSRSGDMPDGVKDTYKSLSGNYVLFLSGTTNVGKGYSAGFTCATVSTTADGAMDAYSDSALPLKHNWDKFFAGGENYATNPTKGGFAAYGDNVGDKNGPFCNDEVKGYLTTPYGTVSVGNIINPMRNLYDATVVDPYYGNERAYYSLVDFRANAIRYGTSIGDFSFDLQYNMSSSPNQSDNDKTGDGVFTGFAAYDFGGGTMLGVGFAGGNGGEAGDKYVNPVGTFMRFKNAWGVTGKTAFGGLGVAAMYFSGEDQKLNYHTNEWDSRQKMSDAMLKLSYNLDAWTFIGIFGYEQQKWNVNGLGGDGWGGDFYTWQGGSLNGGTFSKLNIDRTSQDLWAIYSLGGGVKPYVRLNGIQKKYKQEDGAYAGQSQKLNATLLESGFMVSF